MAMSITEAVRVAPITDGEVRRAAEFLHANLNPRMSAVDWARAVDVPWAVERPNAGFMLLHGDEVVGVQLAFYSERIVDNSRERFCNLGAWCVLPRFRFHGLRLLRAALRQEGYHFTDLSPSGNVVAINERLSFHFLETTTVLVPNVPWPTLPRRGRLIADAELIEQALTGAELDLYRDHASAGAARHVLMTRNNEHCYVIFRRDRRKGLPLFASVLYVSNPELFRAMASRFTRHLLLRHRILATLLDAHVVAFRPRPSYELRSPRRKMFRSSSLAPAQIDYLYSELVCVSW
jgi:hypothetical protein